MSPGKRALLDLGPKLCPTKPCHTTTINKIVDRFKKDAARITFFVDKSPNKRKGIHCIMTLNINNDAWAPPNTQKVVEGAIGGFERAYRSRQRSYKKKVSMSNITLRQSKPTDHLMDNIRTTLSWSK